MSGNICTVFPEAEIGTAEADITIICIFLRLRLALGRKKCYNELYNYCTVLYHAAQAGVWGISSNDRRIYHAIGYRDRPECENEKGD